MGIKRLLTPAILVSLTISCIGEDVVDDFVSPKLRIANPLQSLGINETHQFEAMYLNNIGRQENVEVRWSAQDGSVLSIDGETGLATALQAGKTVIRVSALTPDSLTSTTTLQVAGETVSAVMAGSGSINTTSSYKLTGDFILEPTSTGSLELILDENYEASTSLPGLYVYLSNNPNSINDAFEIGEVTVFRGAHSYSLPNDISFSDYSYLLYWCKPFSVKVGGGDIN